MPLDERHNTQHRTQGSCFVWDGWDLKARVAYSVFVVELEKVFLSVEVSFTGFVPLDVATMVATVHPTCARLALH